MLAVSPVRYHPFSRGLPYGIGVMLAVLIPEVLMGSLAQVSAQKLVFALAAGFLFADLIDVAWLRINKDVVDWRDRLVFVYALGSGFGVVVFLQNWQPAELPAPQLARYLAAGVFFGVFMLLFSRNKQHDLPMRHIYDVIPDTQQGALLRNVEVTWVPTAILVLGGLMIFPPAGGWTQGYVIFQVILLLSLNITQFPKRAGSYFVVSSRGLGIVVLFLFLWRCERDAIRRCHPRPSALSGGGAR